MFIGILLTIYLSSSLETGRFFSKKIQERDDPKFIVIHLDAISTEHFFEELSHGHLPNIEAFFSESGITEYSITYFPSKTPTVISSIRDGLPPGSTKLPGWEYLNEERTASQGMLKSFFQMALSTSRLSNTNILYGTPLLSKLVTPALLNTPYYLKDYDVLQFYWYNIDTQ